MKADQRSAQMAKIRKTDTKPEMVVRRMVHAMGYRYRLHRRDLPGTPDLVFPGRRKIIEVQGCFWHQHPGCRLAKLPATRPDYWLPKLARNQARDVANRAALEAAGWSVLYVWECEIDEIETLRARLQAFLEESAQPAAASAAR